MSTQRSSPAALSAGSSGRSRARPRPRAAATERGLPASRGCERLRVLSGRPSAVPSGQQARVIGFGRERPRRVLLAVSFFLPAPYIIVEALHRLVTGQAPHPSWIG